MAALAAAAGVIVFFAWSDRQTAKAHARVFAAPDDDFAIIFPEGTDVAFIEEIERRPDADRVTWKRRSSAT
jgi:hypothetical protein